VKGRVPRITNQPNVKKTPLSAKRTKRLVDLYKLPISLHALKDGGQYLGDSLVVFRNLETGVPNISIHRMTVTKVVLDTTAGNSYCYPECSLGAFSPDMVSNYSNSHWERNAGPFGFHPKLNYHRSL
jgi:hypothetical protein